MIQNYNTLVDTLTQFATNHLTLKRFKVSFFEQFDNFSTEDNIFPILYAIPNDVSFDTNIDEFSFRIYCVDILQKDRSNESSILNETLLVLRDLTNWLRLDRDVDLNVLNTPTAVPVNNFLTEFTTGWYIDITIEATGENSDCAIPFSDNFHYQGIVCESTYISQFLTCETLASCGSFISLDDRVTALENEPASENYYTISATNSGDDLIFLRNDGGTYSVEVPNPDLSGYIPYVASGLTGSTDRMVETNSDGDITATKDIYFGYISDVNTTTKLSNTINWDIDGVYIGAAITGTVQGQKYIDSAYFYECVADNTWVRLIRG